MYRNTKSNISTCHQSHKERAFTLQCENTNICSSGTVCSTEGHDVLEQNGIPLILYSDTQRTGCVIIFKSTEVTFISLVKAPHSET